MLRVLILTAVIMSACASRRVAEEAPAVPAPSATPIPSTKTKIKYVYVQTPATESAMTIEPFERAPEAPANFWADVVRLFWPLFTMLATGAVLIAGLFAEHLILNRQLAARRARTN